MLGSCPLHKNSLLETKESVALKQTKSGWRKIMCKRSLMKILICTAISQANVPKASFSFFKTKKAYNQFWFFSIRYSSKVHLRRPVKLVTVEFLRKKSQLTLAILYESISIAGKILICFRILSFAVFAVINNVMLLLNSIYELSPRSAVTNCYLRVAL